MQGVARRILELPFDAVEVRNGFPANFVSNPLTAWLNRSFGQQLPEMGAVTPMHRLPLANLTPVFQAERRLICARRLNKVVSSPEVGYGVRPV
jgi:hypothetical protein